MTKDYPLIFDGHNDTVLELCAVDPKKRRDFFAHADHGHVDLPRAQAGGLGGGFFAMYTRSAEGMTSMPGEETGKDGAYEIKMPAPPEYADALQWTIKTAAELLDVEARSDGRVKIVRTAQELADCLRDGIFAMILHIEGAESIGTDFDSLHVFYAMGLRSLGPVWSRPNAFGYGVPFKFPAGPDIGPGLTDAGQALVKECNKLRVMLDLSHLNEKGFWDVEKLSDAPLVATHSCAHALSPCPRNLTDKQLDAIKATNGVVGMNYHIGFLRQDGQSSEVTSLSEIARHAAYVAERIGVEHVGLGSDFDGAIMPHDLRNVTGLPKLMASLEEHGFDDADLRKIAHENWIRVLRDTWGE